MRFAWDRFTNENELDEELSRAGGVLQAFRRGTNAEPGTVPEMWPYYTTLQESGHVTRDLRAEHACLVLYGIHQQGKSFPAHQPGVGLGHALRQLRKSERFSQEAIDARVTRLATAQSSSETIRHLTSLVQLMRSTKLPIRFDYTRLFHDLKDLENPTRAGQVRRRWGAAYYKHNQEKVKEQS